MQQQLHNSQLHVIPKYIKRTRPTAGIGHGCGSPPPTTLPPLWMYSTRKKPVRPSVKPREITRKRSSHTSNRKNVSDFIGTHRIVYYS